MWLRSNSHLINWEHVADIALNKDEQGFPAIVYFRFVGTEQVVGTGYESVDMAKKHLNNLEAYVGAKFITSMSKEDALEV